MIHKFISISILFALSQTSYAQSSLPAEVINRFYQDLSLLCNMKDFSSQDVYSIECRINECAQGGDDCEIKSEVSVPRDIEVLNGKQNIVKNTKVQAYIEDLQSFVKEKHAMLRFKQPQEIGYIKGIDDTPTYRLFTVAKSFTWDGGNTKELHDTIWVKTNINRIAGIRNEFGGARRVSSNNLSSINLNNFSISDLEIQASSFYDKGDFDEALALYRNISAKDWSNSDANFYVMLMEAKNKGCKSLSKKLYQREAAWWYIKNARNQYFTNSLKSYVFDYKILDFKELCMPFMGENISMADIYGTMKPISCGMMVVCDKKSKYGFINENGKLTVDYIYDKAYSYDDNGLALVKKDGKYGYIDTKGTIVIPFKLDNAQPFFYNDHAYCLEDGILKIIDSKGNVYKTITTSKAYHIIEYFRTKENVTFHYKENVTGKDKWDVFDYNGNLKNEGCDKMVIQINQGLICLSKNGHIEKCLDYKW